MRDWREWLLAAALTALGASVLTGALISGLWDASVAPLIATLVVAAGMVGPSIWALARSRPVGLLRFRPIDLLWGVGLGVALCLTAGALAGGAHFPSIVTIGGAPSLEWWIEDAAWGILAAPAVEELFFRGVLLVSLFTILRRLTGSVVAGLAAALVSTGLFVLLHTVTAQTSPAYAASLALLGLAASGVVLLTGRIAGAVILHAVYNTAIVVLGLVGTMVV